MKEEKMSKIRCLSFMIIIICLFGVARAHSEVTNSNLISEIDIKINNAFDMILKAERAGAEINSLIDDINSADILFQEIRIALEEGDSEKAILKSLECINITSKVEEEAYLLSISAANQANTLKERNFLIIRVAIVSIIILSLLIWSRLKQYFMNRTLRMKPMVVKDEP